MSEATKKKGLGRGLAALIAEPVPESLPTGGPLEVSIEAIAPNPLQPRSNIKNSDIKPLSDSIRDKGILEPLLVRRLGPDHYELIAGERRLLAAKVAGLKTVPVILREAVGVERLELALIENLHRQDLNPLEEAESYHRLAEEFGRTQEEIARLTGRDRSTVANLMRLLGLPKPVQADLRQGRLSAGHARALLSLVEADLILSAREQVLARGLSVRETESFVKKLLRPPTSRSAGDRDQAYYESLAENLTRALTAKVRIIRQGRRGRVEIYFSSPEELERLLALVNVKPL